MFKISRKIKTYIPKNDHEYFVVLKAERQKLKTTVKNWSYKPYSFV